MRVKPKGAQAARIRQRKFELVGRYGIADDLLPGSLTLQHHRCGRPSCHCAHDEGHPKWSLTFMANGKKHVLYIPEHLVEEVRRKVDAGRQYQDAVREVLAANAQLLELARKQRLL